MPISCHFPTSHYDPLQSLSFGKSCHSTPPFSGWQQAPKAAVDAPLELLVRPHTHSPNLTSSASSFEKPALRGPVKSMNVIPASAKVGPGSLTRSRNTGV